MLPLSLVGAHRRICCRSFPLFNFDTDTPDAQLLLLHAGMPLAGGHGADAGDADGTADCLLAVDQVQMASNCQTRLSS